MDFSSRFRAPIQRELFNQVWLVDYPFIYVIKGGSKSDYPYFSETMKKAGNQLNPRSVEVVNLTCIGLFQSDIMDLWDFGRSFAETFVDLT